MSFDLPKSGPLFQQLLFQMLGGMAARRSDAAYIFQPYDGMVLFTSASAITATIPADTYALNYVLTGVQFGNGTVTFAAGAGVTFVSKDDPVVTAGQYTLVMAKQVSQNVWLLFAIESSGGGSLPDGGTTGQVLTKASDADGDADWEDASGGGGLLTTTVSVTAAEINALNSSPKQLIAAPGAEKYIDVIKAAAKYTAGSFAFGFSDSYPQIIWGTDVDNSISNMLLEDEDKVYSIAPLNSSNTGADADDAVNQPLMLFEKDADPGGFGGIATSSVGSGGAGYAIDDTGTVSGGDGTAEYTVLTVDGDGAVLTFSVTPGYSYHVSTDNSTSVSTGGGDGAFTVNVDSINPGDGTLVINILYRVVDFS